jgi:uncharacterized surface protein with fasciclin (FAS1) repeats
MKYIEMKYINKSFCLFIVIVSLGISSCKDVWEDHNSQSVSSENLLELIQKEPSLTTFYGYLKKVGYDSILVSSRTYTVWAPTNDALSSLDISITGNDSILKIFIGNHIAYREYTTDIEEDTANIKMLNGKNIQYIKGASIIESATITSPNSYCKNGIMHIISSPIFPKNNIWEYLNASSDLTKLNDAISIYQTVFDVVNSSQIGVNGAGNPVYDSVWVNRNVFLSEVNDVSNEDSVFTVFALNDNCFTHEYEKMSPYIQDTSSNENTIIYRKINVCKDIVIHGKYSSLSSMPDTLISTKGIKIPKSSLSIESSFEASNGIVYKVNSFDIPLSCKIPIIKIEGEDYLNLYNSDLNIIENGKVAIRYRTWASGAKDIQAYGGSDGHGIKYLSAKYVIQNMYNISYNVYRRSVNDFQTSSFRMKLAFNPDSLSDLIDSTSQGDINRIIRYFTISGSGFINYSEQFIGTWNEKQYGKLNIFLVSDCIEATKSSPNYPIELDYLKLVPVFN